MIRSSIVFCGVLLRLSIVLVVFATACSSRKGFTVVSFGGAYQGAQREAYFTPFTKDTEITVTEGEYNGDYGLLRQRATASEGTWDVVSVESAPCMRGTNEGLFRELPASLFEGADLIMGARTSHAVGHLVFSTVLAFRSDSTGKRPEAWASLWDFERFPGKRGLRNNPRGTLEVALMADGVQIDSLYPLDVDRAFKKLDQLGDQIVFWEAGAQPIQLLGNKTVVMTTAYNGRIWEAKTKENIPVDWTFNQGLMELEFWVIPKNARNVDAAFQFVRSSLIGDRQAVFANKMAYGPTNRSALPKVSGDVRAALPSSAEVLRLQVVVDANWWAANEQSIGGRWETWRSRR